jgi:hypothetical protein
MPIALLLLSIDSGESHPTLAPVASWPGVVVIVILLGFIATAAILGPIVRATMRDEKATDEKRPSDSAGK